MRSLLIGAGNSRVKKVYSPASPEWGELVTLDMDPKCGADVTWDMEQRPLPFEAESFDEIHAYDVLEHWGRQGDWRGWFDEMAEYHRLLKPGGTLHAIAPLGADAFADPGHTRFFGANHFLMVTQKFYEEALAKGLQVTDYRWYVKDWWTLDYLEYLGLTPQMAHHFAVMLRKS